jgi:BirA family biotin operon repressor/biotin-[acetyl-CoA-carboxylase] ligase
MLEETESTNKDALAQASAGAPHLTLVWAKRQTKGRGRGGRVWRSGEGNVFYSLLLRPEPDWGDFNHLPYVTALAVHAALRPLTPAERSVTLKWPNDVLIDGAKVSGTLIEADNIRRVDGKLTADAVIVGIGVNVIDHPTDGLIYPATNLRHVGSASERQHVIAALSASLIAAIDLWRAQGFAVIRDAYMARAYGLHKRITVRVSTSLQDAETGEFTGVDDDGALQLKLDDGSVRKVFAGDVFFPT